MKCKSLWMWVSLLLLLGGCGKPPAEETPVLPTAPVPITAAPTEVVKPVPDIPHAYPSPDDPTGRTPQPPAAPSPYPEPPTITPAAAEGESVFFLSNRGGQVDIWHVVVPTGSPEPVMTDPLEERWLSFSPDGHWLAYVAVEGSEQSVRLLDSNGNTVRVLPGSLSTQPLERVAWLNQTTLLYAQQISFHERALYWAAVDGEAQPLPLQGTPEGSVLMDWSAAGGRIVVVVGVPGQSSDLYEAHVEPAGRLVLDQSLADGYRPLLSPDGRYLAYSAPSYDDDPAGYILDLDAGVLVSYNEDDPMRRWDHDLAWSPDSRRLVFVRSSWAWTDGEGRPYYLGDAAEPLARDGVEGLYWVELGRAETPQLTQVGYDTAPVWSPGGQYLAFVSNREDFSRSDVWVLGGSSGEAWSLTAENGDNWGPLWRP